MIRFLLIALAIVSFTACNKPTGIKDFVQSADSVAINYFKGDGTMDTVVKVIVLRDKKQISSLADYVEGGATDEARCGYDGSLHFFKNNMVLKDVDIRMNDVQCMHFSFVLDNNRYTTKLSAEAKTFLETGKK